MVHSHARQTRQAWPPRAQTVPAHEVPALEPNFSPRSSFSISNRTDSHSGAGLGHQSAGSFASPPSINPSPQSSETASSPEIKVEATADYPEEMDMDVDMNSLKSRGKGTYKCRFGLACKKGGVDRNGDLVIFERNCMFR
jgi:hypothetical protein